MEDNQQQVVPPQQAPPVVEPNVSPADVLTPQETSKKGNKAIWFLGLLTALVLLVVAYLAYQNNQLKKELKVVKLSNATVETQVLISPTEAITPTPDPTAGWEAFRNTEYDYYFRFPEGYGVGESGWNYGKPELSSGVLVVVDSGADFDSEALYVDVVDKSLNRAKTTNLKSYMEWLLSENVDRLSSSVELSQELAPIVLGDKEGYSFSTEGDLVVTPGQEFLSPPNRHHKYIGIEHNGNFIIIYLVPVPPFDQILSTFEFTDSADIQCQSDQDCFADHFCDTDIVCPKGTGECSKTGTNLCVSECVTDSDCQSPLVCKEYYYFSGSDVAGTTKLGCTDPLTE